MKCPRLACFVACLIFTPPAYAADYQTGFPYTGMQRHFTLVDVDDDGTPEILFASTSQGIHIIDHDASDTTIYTFCAAGQPLVGDLEGDGELDVVFRCIDNCFAITITGAPKPGWPVSIDQESASWQLPSATLADLDGDGDDEFVVLGRVDDMLLHVIDGDGTALTGWPATLPVSLQPNEHLIFAGVTAADLDFDGSAEVITGLHTSIPGGFTPAPLIVFEGDGSLRPGFPVEIPWSFGTTPQLLFPRVADLDGDLQCEIFGPAHFGLHAYRNDGTQFFTPKPTVYGRPGATGDLDGDGDVEIIMPGERLRIFDKNGVLLAQTPITPYTIFEAVTLGDVNGDGIQEICARSMWENGDWGQWVHLFDTSLNELPGWPKYLGNSQDDVLHVTAMADLDGDNDLEIMTAQDGVLHVWDEPNPSTGLVSTEWPVWGHDSRRSENYHAGIPLSGVHLIGDFNGDSGVDLADAIAVLVHLFVTPSASNCLAAGDFDGDGSLDLADPISMLGFMFTGSPAPWLGPVCTNSQLQPLPCSRTQCP